MKRLSYIDWMRGLACLLMFQTHCYDSWLRPDLHESHLYKLSQFGGTLPAPLFIFLAGVSFALVTEKLRKNGLERNAIAKQTILRGAEVFGFGILFRVQEFILGFKKAPWTDLLRVDVLNILGISMILMGALCWLVYSPSLESARSHSIFAAMATAALIALATPPLWTTHRPSFLPWPLESYINGVHTHNEPQHWLFPIFPWSAFAFAGLGTGFSLFTEFARKRETVFFLSVGGAGIVACAISTLLHASAFQPYAVYDYWHSSPNFLLMRCGVLLIILSLVYAWCRWGFGQKGFSPVIQLGSTSLLVYWVHIEFVYGGLSILPKRGCDIPRATLGLGVIFLAMLLLSIARTRYKQGGVRALSPWSRQQAAPATG